MFEDIREQQQAKRGKTPSELYSFDSSFLRPNKKKVIYLGKDEYRRVDRSDKEQPINEEAKIFEEPVANNLNEEPVVNNSDKQPETSFAQAFESFKEESAVKLAHIKDCFKKGLLQKLYMVKDSFKKWLYNLAENNHNPVPEF